MGNDFVNENLDICSECGGKCCIKCGCDYGAGDFADRSYKALLQTLSEGDKSIVAAISFSKKSDGSLFAEPFLYIRARNVNRDIVDLVSMKTRCSLLGESGCKYDYANRPLGGRNLRPSKLEDGLCRPVISPLYILKTWLPYQKQLSKIVKYYTGMSVDKKIREDVENLFYDDLMKNYDGVMFLEYVDLRGFISDLIKAYPVEYNRAIERAKKPSFIKVLNR